MNAKSSPKVTLRNVGKDDEVTSSPSTGVFWGIQIQSDWVLLYAKAALEHSEPYGDFLTFPIGHAEIWEPLTRMSAAQLVRAQLPIEILTGEYSDFPRGRVVFHRPDRLFTIYADVRTHRPYIVSAICEALCLTNQKWTVRLDEHYR